MFRRIAPYYDLLYRSIKDYPAEAVRIDYLLGQLDPKPVHLLDVGCGTGEHARELARDHGYRVDGVDLEPQLVALAAKKNSAGDFTVGDMRQLNLPAKYDAILCLFSSIGYVETLESLAAAARSFARHLRPGGWLLLEPWAEPSEWTDDLIDAYEAEDETTGAKILQARRGQRVGNLSILTIDYHIETPNGNWDFTEEHRLGLFSRSEIKSILEAEGFATRYAPSGILDRPVHLACYLP